MISSQGFSKHDCLMIAMLLMSVGNSNVSGFTNTQKYNNKVMQDSRFILSAATLDNTETPSILSKSTKSLSFSTDKVQVGSLRVPSVGIGTIAWCDDGKQRGELDSLVKTACNNDVAFFDTAERYGSKFKSIIGLGWGETERLTRDLISKHDDEQHQTRIFEQNYGNNKEGRRHAASSPIVATKFTPSPWRSTADSVIEACEKSRENLGAEQIDLYQLHMPDIVKPLRKFGLSDGADKDKIYWDGMIQCYKNGLIKNVGVCNYGPTLLMECTEYLAKHNVPLVSNQIGYSLIGRSNGAQETVDVCNEAGIKVLAYFPFAMGLLTGKYSSKSSNDETSKTSRKRSKLELNDLQRYAEGDGITIPKGGISPLLAKMEDIALARNKSIAQIALNYIICKGAIPIPGARTESQFIDNIGAMGWRLSLMEVHALEEEANKLGIFFEGAGFKRTNEKFVGYGVEKWSLN